MNKALEIILKKCNFSHGFTSSFDIIYSYCLGVFPFH